MSDFLRRLIRLAIHSPPGNSVAHRKSDDQKHAIKVRVTEFTYPPIHDGLVLGKASPIGCAAIRKAIDLLGANAFDHIEIEDDVVSDILVRHAIVRRLGRAKLIAFVLDRVKPLMQPEEILHLDIEVEIQIEETDL